MLPSQNARLKEMGNEVEGMAARNAALQEHLTVLLRSAEALDLHNRVLSDALQVGAQLLSGGRDNRFCSSVCGCGRWQFTSVCGLAQRQSRLGSGSPSGSPIRVCRNF